jgi:DNA-directed RNA polymerase
MTAEKILLEAGASAGDIKRQLQLEHESVELGIKKYRDNVVKRSLTDLPPGQRLLKMAIEPFMVTMKNWLETPLSGRCFVYKNFFRQFRLEIIAFLTVKRIVNNLGTGGRGFSFQSTAISIADMLIDHLEYLAFKKEAPGYVYTIEKDNKWASESHRRATLLRAKTKLLGRAEFTSVQKVQIGSRCIETLIEATGLVEKILTKNPKTRKSNYQLCATQVLQEWLEKAHNQCELLQPMNFPMVVFPVDWNDPVSGGFLTNQNTHQIQLMKTRDIEELMALAEKDLSRVYSAVNSVQRTAWRINQKIYRAMEEVWAVGDRAGLPAKELPELPRKTWEKGVEPPKRELLAWKKIATKIHEQHARERSKRVAIQIKLYIAGKMLHESKLYFVWTLDWRGRMYPVQQFVNPQADDSGRALLEFSMGKPLGADGAFWLAVHGANTFGYDKASFEERVAWVVENEPAILGSADDPMSMIAWWEQADDPFQFLAFCMEWRGYREEGESYVSHLPVSLDGSCNGLQNFSAMLRDEVGGKATNLVPLQAPSDIYQEVADVLSAKVRRDAPTEPLAAPWLGRITRKMTKRGVMTTPYGVTRYGLRKQLQFEVEKIDRHFLGELTEPGKYYAYLSNHLFDAIGEVVVAARTAMAWLQEVAVIAAKSDKVIRWTSPVGFPPCQDYRRQKMIRVDTLYGGIRVRYGLWQDTVHIDKRKMSSGISPNFVHSLDASHLMLTVNRCQDFGIQNFSCVHDSFGTLAADAGRLAYYLRESFIEQYNEDVLQKFRDEVVAQLPAELIDQIPPLPPKGGLDLQKIRESRYFFA